MRALSIKQPWANLIIEGTKQIENRTWRPPQSVIGQRIAIHASKSLDKNAPAWAFEHLRDKDSLVRGAIIGTARLDGFVTESTDDWFSGPIGWTLSDVFPVPEPIPINGRLGLWEVPKWAVLLMVEESAF